MVCLHYLFPADIIISANGQDIYVVNNVIALDATHTYIRTAAYSRVWFTVRYYCLVRGVAPLCFEAESHHGISYMRREAARTCGMQIEVYYIY